MKTQKNELQMTGDELKSSRLSLGYSQKEMAEKLGTPHTTYRNWERHHSEYIKSGTLRAAVEKVEELRGAELSPEELKKLGEKTELRYLKLSNQKSKRSGQES